MRACLLGVGDGSTGTEYNCKKKAEGSTQSKAVLNQHRRWSSIPPVIRGCSGCSSNTAKLELAYFSPNIDEFSRVRVPKSGYRAQSGRTKTKPCVSLIGVPDYPTWGALRGRRGSIRLKIGLFQRPSGESSRVDVPKTGPRGQG